MAKSAQFSDVRAAHDQYMERVDVLKAYVLRLMGHVEVYSDDAKEIMDLLADIKNSFDNLDESAIDVFGYADIYWHAYSYLRETGKDYFTGEKVVG